MIIQSVLDIVRAWHMVVQFLFAATVATLGSFILMALTAMAGEFINQTLPVLLRGWPPDHCKKDEDDE